MSSELNRYRRLAKAWAVAENEIVAIYRNDDGSYGFTSMANESEIDKPIIEFITPY